MPKTDQFSGQEERGDSQELEAVYSNGSGCQEPVHDVH